MSRSIVGLESRRFPSCEGDILTPISDLGKYNLLASRLYNAVAVVISDKRNAMKTLIAWASLGLVPLFANAAQPWQEIMMPTVAEAAATFPTPPKELSAIHWAIWGGQQTKERVIADIDKTAANGGGVYMINNSQRVQP